MISSIISKWFLRAQLISRRNESLCLIYLVRPPFAAVTAAHLSGFKTQWSFMVRCTISSMWFVLFWRRVSERPCRWSRRSSWTVWSFTSHLGCLLVQWWKKPWRRGIRYVHICFDLQCTKMPVLIVGHGLCPMAAQSSQQSNFSYFVRCDANSGWVKVTICALQTSPKLGWPLLSCDAFKRISGCAVFLEIFPIWWCNQKYMDSDIAHNPFGM